jgi:hypothetical protein
MKGLTLTNLAIMMIIGASVMIGMGTFYLNSLNAYGITQNASTLQTFNNFNNSINSLNSSVVSLQNKIAQVTNPNGNPITQLYDIMTAFFPIGQIILNIPSIAIDFIGNMIAVLSGGAIQVPDWVSIMIIIIIIFIVTMQLIRIFTRSFIEP